MQIRARTMTGASGLFFRAAGPCAVEIRAGRNGVNCGCSVIVVFFAPAEKRKAPKELDMKLILVNRARRATRFMGSYLRLKHTDRGFKHLPAAYHTPPLLCDPHPDREQARAAISCDAQGALIFNPAERRTSTRQSPETRHQRKPHDVRHGPQTEDAAL